MATVFLAEDLKHRRRVAIKVLRPELAAAIGPERFLREIEHTAKLHHPHILQLYDSGNSDGLLYYVMPFVEGESLRQQLDRQGKLRVAEALTIAQEVADALGYAHERGLVHRDIKPENILLESGHALVADFGIARVLSGDGSERLTATGVAVGTPSYMSPEQAAGDANVDGRSDLYSLGCVTFEMLTGQAPFTGPSLQAVLAKRFTEDPPDVASLRPEIADRLRNVVSTLLAREPTQRFATAADLVRALRDQTDNVGQAPHVPSSDRSTLLAVLPFKDFSAGADQEWFAAGTHEALLIALQQIGKLRVTSRASAMHFQKTDMRSSEIAKELKVHWLVDGSVVRSGDRIRITAQLIDGPTETHVWANQYERDVRDVLAVQSEVARAVAKEIHVAISPEEVQRLDGTPQVDPETYKDYILGLHHFDRVTPNDFRRCVQHFERAIAADASFARAHAALTVAYGIAVEYGWTSRTAARAPAQRAAREALRLDPGSGDSHHAQASFLFHMQRDFPAAERAFQKALALTTNAYALLGYGWLLSQMGRHDEAVAVLERAVVLDPLSSLMHGDLGWWLYGARRYPEAIEQATEAIALDPTFPEGYWLLASAQAQLGQYDESLRNFGRYEDLYGQPVDWFRGYLLGLADRREQAHAALDIVKQRVETGDTQHIELAQVYLGLGEHERVLDVLDSAPEAGVSFQPYLWPEYEPLLSHPRMAAVLKRHGIPIK